MRTGRHHYCGHLSAVSRAGLLLTLAYSIIAFDVVRKPADSKRFNVSSLNGKRRRRIADNMRVSS